MKVPPIVVAIFVATGLVSFLVSEWSEIRKGEICQKNEYTQQKECATYTVLPFLVVKIGKFLDDHAGAIGAIATVLIGWFTLALFRATDELKIIGRNQINALLHLERPWLFLEAVRVSRREGAPINPTLPNNWWISLRWRNVGRAPAVIEECIIFFEPTDQIPVVPNYSNPSTLSCPHTVAKDIPFDTPEIGPAEIKRTRNGEPVNLTVYGRLTYKELNGETHHTGFIVDVSPHFPVYSVHKNKNYDYYD